MELDKYFGTGHIVPKSYCIKVPQALMPFWVKTKLRGVVFLTILTPAVTDDLDSSGESKKCY